MTSGGSAASAIVQRALESLVAGGAPGALAEVRDGTGSWPLSAGITDLRTRRPVSASSRVRIGSVTKTFTATLVLQLIGEGRLGIEDTVERWLPGLVPLGEAISVRQLLDHRSGLHNYTDGLDSASILRDRFVRWCPREVVTQAVTHPATFTPGTSRMYCNTGYLVLGLIVEAVSGRTYENQLVRRILAPLNLVHTMAGTTDVMPDPYLHGYLATGDELVDVTEFDSSQAWAAGGMVSTATDLNRFYAALFGGELLNQAERRLMRTTSPTSNSHVDAGLGMFRVRLPGCQVVWGKGGGFFGYHTWSFHTEQAERQVTISMSVANNDRPSSPRILAEIAGAFIGT